MTLLIQANSDSSAIKCSAVRTQAALKAASYQSDQFKWNHAAQELERLGELNFSAMSAGRDIVHHLIEEGSRVLVNTYLTALPIDMLGLTSGHASGVAFEALCNRWVPILNQEMGDYLPKAEAESLCRDLWIASMGHIEQRFSEGQTRKRRWRLRFQSIIPETLTLGMSSWLPVIKVEWRFKK